MHVRWVKFRLNWSPVWCWHTSEQKVVEVKLPAAWCGAEQRCACSWGQDSAASTCLRDCSLWGVGASAEKGSSVREWAAIPMYVAEHVVWKHLVSCCLEPAVLNCRDVMICFCFLPQALEGAPQTQGPGSEVLTQQAWPLSILKTYSTKSCKIRPRKHEQRGGYVVCFPSLLPPHCKTVWCEIAKMKYGRTALESLLPECFQPVTCSPGGCLGKGPPVPPWRPPGPWGWAGATERDVTEQHGQSWLCSSYTEDTLTVLEKRWLTALLSLGEYV